jgi:ribulose-bisphosphate carboxylase large chain
VVPELLEFMGTDIIVQAGGGIHGHPDGTYAGARAMRQAVEAAMQKVPLTDYAEEHKELKRALEKWSS